MKIEVGKLYLTRSGKKILIVQRTKRPNRYPFLGDNKERYMHDGRWSSFDESERDLIKEL